MLSPRNTTRFPASESTSWANSGPANANPRMKANVKRIMEYVRSGGFGSPARQIAYSSSSTPLHEIGRKAVIFLDNKSCQWYHLFVLDIQVIDDPAVATVALEPIRSRLLSHMATPASAATLATRVGLAR